MQKKKLNWIRWIVIYFVPFCFIWGIWLLHSWKTVHQLTNTQQIDQMVPIQFPENSQVMDGYYAYGLPAHMIGKVKIPANSLHQFISQPLLDGSLRKQEKVPDFDNGDPELQKLGWNLKAIKRYLASDYIHIYINQSDRPAKIAMKIDLDHREYCVVYFDFVDAP